VGWHVEDGPHQLINSKDASVWQFDLRETAHISKRVRVELSGTAAAIAESGGDLPEPVLDAFKSQGRSAVESTLDWAEPPDVIVMTTHGEEKIGGIGLSRVSHLAQDASQGDVRCSRCGKLASQVSGYTYIRGRVEDEIYMRRIHGHVEVFFDEGDEIPQEFEPCRPR
jgi:hypothetical protein